MDKHQLFSSIDKQFKKAGKQRKEIAGLRKLLQSNDDGTDLKEYLKAQIKDHWNKLDSLTLTEENAESQIFLETFRKDLQDAKVKLRELDELTKNELKGN